MNEYNTLRGPEPYTPGSQVPAIGSEWMAQVCPNAPNVIPSNNWTQVMIGSACFISAPSTQAGCVDIVDSSFLTAGSMRLTMYDSGASTGDAGHPAGFVTGTVKHVFQLWRFSEVCDPDSLTFGAADLIGEFSFDYTFGPLAPGAYNPICAELDTSGGISLPHKFQQYQTYAITYRCTPGVTGYTTITPSFYADLDIVFTSGSSGW